MSGLWWASTTALLRRLYSHRLAALNTSNPKMDVHILPALEDNFMYLLVDKATGEAAVVDPVTPKTVLEKVKELGGGVKLTTVLTTHHHWDHAGGNKELSASFQGDRKLRVFGGEDRVEAVTDIVTTGDMITFGQGGVTVECFHTPCHTRGHICYKVTNSSDKDDISLFTGKDFYHFGPKFLVNKQN